MMDVLLPTAFILLLTTGGCAGQDALRPASLDGAVGGDVTFMTTVNSAGKDLDSIIWQFTTGPGPEVTVFNSTNKTAGPGYEDRINVNMSTGSLVLRKLRLKDAGNYSVSLSVNGSAQTGKAKLNMYEKISGANITGPTEVLIAGNSSANLSCQAAAEDDISFMWQKDGEPLSPSNRITFSMNNNSVSIKSVQSTDNGQYQCMLTNPVSSATANYNLTVNFGPEKIAIFGNQKAEVNSKVELVCNASSVPPATYSWLVNGTEKGTKSSFIIENVDPTDTGNYTCVASNDVTKQNSFAFHYLTVTEPQPVPESSQSLSGGAIAGIVIGTIGGVGVIGGGGFFAYKRWYQ